MKKTVVTYFLISLSFFAFSQKGKNGAGNIVASNIVNAYTSLTANAFIGNTTINVASSAGYAVGDLIYIIQMQGASVNCYINPFGNPNNIEPISPAFGKITNYNNAGNNEYAEISSIAGNVITIDCPLGNNYTSAGKVQVIKVPRYTSLTIGASGVITCPQWNGTIGGVIAIEVDGNTVINAGGKIDASGLGFRGGAITGKTVGSVFGGGSFGNSNINEGGYKGESIAGSVADYSTNFNGPFCKGAVANGGGGGNGNNAGGGGGANAGDTSLYLGTGNPDISIAGYVTAWNLESPGFAGSTSSGGGRGGYSYSNTGLNPRTTAPGLASWTGDNRSIAGGIGGRPLNYNTGRLYSGGGGGAADENDAFGGGGGNGGGIINIISYGTVSGSGQILANGQNGFNTLTPAPGFNISGRDGAGGGGGGGAIVINSTGLINSITVSAKGGDGGNQQMKNGGFTTTGAAYGPGGGGGGGYIGTTAAAITTNANGGVNGTVQYLSGLENCQIDIVPATNSFPANGATIGGIGTVTATLQVVPTITASPDVTICINNSAALTATTTGPPSTIGWYTNFAGPTLLGTGSAFTTSVFTAVGTYTVWAGFCPGGIYRDPVVITVTNGPTLTATSQTVCSSQTTTLVAGGATNYTWSTGATSATINPSPAATTVYTVVGANGTCTASTTSTVTVNSSGSLSVNSATICSGQSATLSAGAAVSYTWSTSQNIPVISVNPLTTTVYTLNATLAGGCNVIKTATVTVISNPTVTVNNPSICAGQSATLTASGATSYLWYDGTTNPSVVVGPNVTASFSVIGNTAGCTATAAANVSVTPNPTLTANSVSICAGQIASFVGNGASTYTWDPTGINYVGSTFTVIPLANNTYTMFGSINGCVSTTTVSVNVGSNLSLSVNSPTICSGQSATLIAVSSATNYSWSNGATTYSTAVNPVVSTVYTVNGNFAGCAGFSTVNVIVNPTPILTNTNITICSGQSTTLNAVGATNYTWSTLSNNSSITVSPLVNTTYSLLGATGSCTSAANYSVLVAALPVIITNSSSICNGASATLTANGATTFTWLPLGTTSNTISVNPSVNTTYTVIGSNGTCSSSATATVIVTNGGTVAVTGATICNGQNAVIGTNVLATSYNWNNGASGATISVSPNSNTVYSLQVVSGGCILTGSTSVIVTPAPIINATNASICIGDYASLFAGGAVNYTWSPGNMNGNNIVVNPSVTTTYVVSSYSNGCISTATAQVQVNSKPNLTITPQNVRVCPNTPVTYSVSGASSYDWYVDGMLNYGNPIVVSPTKTSLILVFGHNGGCSSSSVTTLYVQNINASFVAESNYVDYPGTISFTNTSSGYSSLIWEFGNGQTSTHNGATALYEYPGKYTVALMVKDTMGCSDTAFYVIEAGCGKGDIYIPNTFTPNNDGLNDVFKVYGGTCLTSFNGSVFDRWGHVIFVFKELSDVWDGKLKGTEVENGVYNYLINYTLYNGKQITKTGIITIAR